MSVESGGSIGIVGGAAPVSGLSFGPELVMPSSPIVSEGPASLENTMRVQTSVFNPIGEIRFTPQVLPEASGSGKVNTDEPVKTEVPKVFLEAFGSEPDYKLDPVKNEAAIEPEAIAKPAVWFADIIEPAVAWKSPLVFPQPRVEPVAVPNGIVVSPSLEEETEGEKAVKAESKTDSKVSSKTAQAEEQQEEQILVDTQLDKQQAAKTQDEEQLNRRKRGLVEDRLKTKTRDNELGQASKEAVAEAQALGILGVEGWRIVAKLVPQHPGDRSETLNEEDPQNAIPDGSWEAVKVDIRTRRFTSLEEAKEVITVINRKYRPEKRGEDDDITEEEHQRVHSGHRHSSERPLQILERRIVKKDRQPLGANPISPLGWTKKDAKETTLKDLGLAEIFQKAA